MLSRNNRKNTISKTINFRLKEQSIRKPCNMSLKNNELRGVVESNTPKFVEIDKKTSTITKCNDISSLISRLNCDVDIENTFTILFIISNYERFDMLKSLLTKIKNITISNINIDYVVYDDVSSYKLDDPNFIVNDEHRGKIGYWKTFDDMFKYAKNNYHDAYVFIPNDFTKIDFNKIIKYAIKFRNTDYIFNLINDGRLVSWNTIYPIMISNEIRLQYFTDCGFFTNYQTLNLLDFNIYPIYSHCDDRGSGVGNQLTGRINELKIPILTPLNSFAFHGEHESLMNKKIRERNKLISRHG